MRLLIVEQFLVYGLNETEEASMERTDLRSSNRAGYLTNDADSRVSKREAISPLASRSSVTLRPLF